MSNILYALHEIDKPGFALNSVFFIQKRRFVVKVTEALTFSKSRNKEASNLFEKLRESSSTLLECELEPPNGSCYQEKRIHSLRAYFGRMIVTDLESRLGPRPLLLPHPAVPNQNGPSQ